MSEPFPSKRRPVRLTAENTVVLDGMKHRVLMEGATGNAIQNITSLNSEAFDQDSHDSPTLAERLRFKDSTQDGLGAGIDPKGEIIKSVSLKNEDELYTIRQRKQIFEPLSDADPNHGNADPEQETLANRSVNKDGPAKRLLSSWQKLPDLIRGTEVRKIRRRGYIGYTGDVPMTRLRGKVLSAESLLEADFLVVTDAQDDDIVEMAAQPLALAIVLNGEVTSWIPDYKIVRSTGVRELVEVKPLSKLRSTDPKKRAKVTARLDACRVAARAAGYTFRLVTEQEIRVQPLLYNAKLIHRHMHGFGNRQSIMRAILALPSLGTAASVAALGSALDEPVSALALAIRLDRLGHIRLDREVQFSKATTFKVLSPDLGGEP